MAEREGVSRENHTGGQIKNISLRYLGGYRWRFPGITYPDVTVRSGEEFLTSRRLAELRRLLRERGLSEEDLRKIARHIDNVLSKEKAERKNQERAQHVFEDTPAWRRNAELLAEAERYIQERLKQISSVGEYLTFLKGEVLKDLAAGNEDVKLAFLVLLQLDNFIIILPGAPSLGKNFLADGFLECIDTFTISRSTKHALDYIPEDEVKGKVIYVKETATLGDEESVHALKQLYLDYDQGLKGYVIAYPIKDPKTGKLVTTRKVLPARGFVSTTNLEFLNQSLLERTWILRLDDSPEATKAALLYIGRDEKEKLEKELGLRKWTSREWSQALIHVLLKKLSSETAVWIPAIESLPVIVLGEKLDLETRRQARRLIAFLKAFGKLLSPVLPTIRTNGRQLKLLTLEALIAGCNQFLKLVEFKQEFKAPSWIKFAEKLLEVCEEEGILIVDVAKRNTLARKLGYAPNTVYQKLRQLQQNLPAAVDAFIQGKELIFRIDLEALAEAVIESRAEFKPHLSQQQLEALRETYKSNSVERLSDHKRSNTAVPRVFAENNSENLLFPENKRFQEVLSENTSGAPRTKSYDDTSMYIGDNSMGFVCEVCGRRPAETTVRVFGYPVRFCGSEECRRDLDLAVELAKAIGRRVRGIESLAGELGVSLERVGRVLSAFPWIFNKENCRVRLLDPSILTRRR